MDKIAANNLKRNLDEARKVWAKYPAQCQANQIQFCQYCDHHMSTPKPLSVIECQFELAPVTTRGLPCPYYSHTV